MFLRVTRATCANHVVQCMRTAFAERRNVVLRQSSFASFGTVVAAVVLRRLNFEPLGMRQVIDRSALFVSAMGNNTRLLLCRMRGIMGAVSCRFLRLVGGTICVRLGSNFCFVGSTIDTRIDTVMAALSFWVFVWQSLVPQRKYTVSIS